MGDWKKYNKGFLDGVTAFECKIKNHSVLLVCDQGTSNNGIEQIRNYDDDCYRIILDGCFIGVLNRNENDIQEDLFKCAIEECIEYLELKVCISENVIEEIEETIKHMEEF